MLSPKLDKANINIPSLLSSLQAALADLAGGEQPVRTELLSLSAAHELQLTGGFFRQGTRGGACQDNRWARIPPQ